MRQGTLVLMGLLSLTYVIQACGDDDDESESVVERLGIDSQDIESWGRVEMPDDQVDALREVQSCSELTEALREALTMEMREQVRAARATALNGYCYDYSYSDYGGGFGCSGAMYDAESAPTTGEQMNDGGGGASEYSTTNTQEVGVDEADFIKNDGEYIYIVSGNEFQIIRAWPAEEAHQVVRVTIDGTPQSMYVHHDRAVIYSYDPTATCYGSYNYHGGYCNQQPTSTTITVLDISDRAQPFMERQIVVDGAYVNSRRIGDSVYSVLSFVGLQVPNIQLRTGTDACDAESIDDVNREYEELIEYNEQVIEETVIEYLLPRVSSRTFAEDGSEIVETMDYDDCSNILIPNRLSGTGFVSVLSFDLADRTSSNMTNVVGQQGVVYASSESLYVASVRNAGGGEGAETTTLHRFSLDDEAAEATYEASGRIGGRVLNQFSMGEHEGHLRVATSTGYLPSPNAFNSVYVLGQEGRDLEVTGVVTPIAPTEDIRSARFVGDRGFIVTFKKTDPLFVLDLSDPYDPTIEGELHIPGFSTYMHMMDHDHLLTIGYDADDQGSFAWFTGIQLQVFDVSDMNNPTLAHRHTIGTRGTTSEATTNHLAFNYFAPRDILSIPMAICEESEGGGAYGDVMTFNGLMVFDVTADDGFREHGRVGHALLQDDGYYSGCYNWWTTPNSGVRRSIIMDDYVYSVASDRINIAHLDDLSTPVSSVYLALTQSNPYYDR